MLLQALGRSIALFGERAFWLTALKALLLTIPLAALAFWVGLELVDALPHSRVRLVNAIVQAVGAIGAAVAALMLFPALSGIVVGLFLDDIAEATEKRFYPADPPGTPVGVGQSVREGLRLALRVIGVNLLVLPLYIIFLFVPPVLFLLYTAVNGWLLSREYFGMVAARHMDAVAQRKLRGRFAGRLFLAGCLIALLFAVPVLNLAAPLIGTALMVHVFKGVASGATG